MNVLIIEDEAAALRRIKKLIKEIQPQVNILGNAESIEDAIQLINTYNNAELIFMDIHLADGSSLEIFKHIEVNIPVVFTTAYDQYAIDAFRVNALDYLLKPIKKEDISKVISKFTQATRPANIDYQKLTSLVQTEQQERRFLIKFGQQIRLVSVSEVAYFYTQDKITFLVTHTGKRYPIDHSLEKLEQMISPNQFFRINRQFIINMKAILEMYAYSKSRVRIVLNPPTDIQIIVSTERSSHFKKWLIGDNPTE